MKKVFLYSLLALLPILNSATARAIQAERAAPAQTSQTTAQAGPPCVGKSGEKLENKDAEVNSFVRNIHSLTIKVVNAVDAAPSASDGVDAAQKLLDARRFALHAQFTAINFFRLCQMSREVQKSVSDSLYQDGIKVGQLTARYGADPAVNAKLKKLTQDFTDIFLAPLNDAPKVSVDPCAGKPVSKLESKDAEVDAFVNAINAFTDELVRKVEAAPNPSDGVDAAQNYMDTEKQRLRAQFNSIKDIGECKVTAETKKRMQDDFYQDGVKVGQLTAKYGADPAVKAKLRKLTQDYLALFDM